MKPLTSSYIGPYFNFLSEKVWGKVEGVLLRTQTPRKLQECTFALFSLFIEVMTLNLCHSQKSFEFDGVGLQ